MKTYFFFKPYPAVIKAEGVFQASRVYREDIAPLDWYFLDDNWVMYFDEQGMKDNVREIGRIDAMRIMRTVYPELSIKQRYEILTNPTPEVLVVNKTATRPSYVLA